MHGDTPFTRVQPLEGQRSSRDHSTIVGHPYSSSGRRYPPETRGSWKRKYSLRHKNPQSSAPHPFITTSSCNDRGEASVKTTTGLSGSALQSPKHVTQMTTGTTATCVSKKTESLVAQHGHSNANQKSSSTLVPHETHHITFYRTQQMPGSRCVVPPENNTIPNTSHSLPSLVSKTESKRTITTAVPAATTTITPSVATLPKLAKQPSSNLSTHSNHRQTSRSTNSKFVWVKTQNVEVPELQKSSTVAAPAGKRESNFPPSNSGAESTVCKKTPDKKPPRRLTQVSGSPKTFKYKWVSSTAAQSKISRKSLLLKLPLPQRALETGDSPNKVTTPTKTKKEVATSSRSSRYSWDAGTAGGTAVPRRSSFHWTSEKHREVRESFSSGTLCTSLPCTSRFPGAFKLHSRMKIIHRWANRSVNISSKNYLKLKVDLSLWKRICIFSQTCTEAQNGSTYDCLHSITAFDQFSCSLPCSFTHGSVYMSPLGGSIHSPPSFLSHSFLHSSFCGCSGSEKVSSTSGVRVLTPGRSPAPIRCPPGVRRSSSRELVSFGRHKLRRLCTSVTRTSKECTLLECLIFIL